MVLKLRFVFVSHLEKERERKIRRCLLNMFMYLNPYSTLVLRDQMPFLCDSCGCLNMAAVGVVILFNAVNILINPWRILLTGSTSR